MIFVVVAAEGADEGISAETDAVEMDVQESIHTAIVKLGANPSKEAKEKCREGVLKKEKVGKEKLTKVKEKNVKLREKIDEAPQPPPPPPAKPLCGELQVAKKVCKDKPT